MHPSPDRFLAGVRPGAPTPLLINERTGRTVSDMVELAVASSTRRTGLLGRDSFAPGAAIVIAPCWAVHTGFMRFAIDVVFVDRKGRVRKIVTNLPPWRIALSYLSYAVIEFAAGSLAKTDVTIGDRLVFNTNAGRDA